MALGIHIRSGVSGFQVGTAVCTLDAAQKKSGIGTPNGALERRASVTVGTSIACQHRLGALRSAGCNVCQQKRGGWRCAGRPRAALRDIRNSRWGVIMSRGVTLLYLRGMIWGLVFCGVWFVYLGVGILVYL